MVACGQSRGSGVAAVPPAPRPASSPTAAVAAPPLAQDFGTAVALGRALFTGYLFPLQLAAVLLFVALIGAIVLSKRRW